MVRKLHFRFLVASLTLFLCAGALAKNKPDVDALSGRKGNPNARASVAQRVGELARRGAPLHVEERLGVPTFVWVDPSHGKSAQPQGQGAERREAGMARAHLNKVAHAYGLTRNDVIGAELDSIVRGARGAVVVKFKQKIDGVEVFREELNVVMNAKLEAVAVTGHISSRDTPAAQGQAAWSRSADSASRDALADATGLQLGNATLVKSGARDGYDFYSFASAVAGLTLVEPVRLKPVWFHLPEGVVPSYYVEVMTTNATPDVAIDADLEESAYAYVISAIDGSILFRKNLISHGAESNALPAGGFTYKVWADPVTGIPYDSPAGNSVHPKLVPVPDGAQHPFVPMQTVTLPSWSFSAGDPWLAPGATVTNGNNVDAFVNLVNAAGNVDNGYGPVQDPPADPATGDHRAFATGADAFVHTHQPDVDAFSVSARSASIVQLFYNINFLHDWFYDSGFNEAARNAQKDNYGRGGLQNDDIKAQVADAGGFSNANMLTPADGSRPRMRMYNFPNPANTLDVTGPAGIAQKIRIGISQTGTRAFDVTGNIVIATFSNAPTACTITNAAALAGNIAMFDFDNTDGTGCAFSTRISRIHATSAAAALMVYNSAPANAALVANVTGINATHTKPVAIISWNSAAPIKTQLASTPVTARLLRMADRDGALDNQIVFHEWGHYISNRLIGNATGLNNQQGGAMGEGWGDFVGMLLTVRPDDTLTPSNATWGGPYALATYATSGVPFNGTANHGYYLGIRRTPYSTDMTNFNALTFKHIQDGIPLPVGPPIATSSAPNSQVHNSGEVWATMLWECYASLLRDTQGPAPRLTFQQAQDRMKQYLVASLAMTPSSPTYLEARDAVLAAAYANDVIDYVRFAQAFAKRGAGIYAVAPDRFSTNHVAVTESYEAGAEIVLAGSTLDDSAVSCDNDGILDGGETGVLTLVVRNTGVDNLVATTATITSTTPGISFPDGNTVSFPAMSPFAEAIGSVRVQYAMGISGVQQIDFSISTDDPALDAPRAFISGFRGNSDDIPASSATDSVEAASTPWTLTSDVALFQDNPWTRQVIAPLDREWHIDDPGAASDQRLESPLFTVDGSGSMNLQFDHSWSFEFDASGDYDGGVIEMQVNGGAWTDIGSSLYNGTLVNYSGNLNPLRTRPALTKTGSGHASLSQAIAPGSTVRVRFRFGSDNAAGAPGWNVDNIAFTGVVETPFATVVGDPGCLTPPSNVVSLTSSANPSPRGAALTLTATVTSLSGTPDGAVTFFDGDVALGAPVSLVSGTATFTTSSLTVGAHLLSAVWDGGAFNLASNVPTLAQNISKIATTVDLTSSSITSTECNAVTFTAVVAGTTGTPTGSVSFSDGATPLGSVALSGGSASFTVSSMTAGSHTINAVYTGSSEHDSSSDSLVQTVNPTPAQPVASNSGPYCEGATINLSTPLVTGATYSWTGPGSFTSPDREPSIAGATLAHAGVYSVTVTVDGCVSPAGTTTVVVNPTPATPVITPAGPTTFCEGGSVTLSSSSASGNQWYLDGNPIGGSTSQTYAATAAGSYTVVATENNCPSAPSAPVAITVNPIPATPTIAADGPVTFCTGGSVTLTASSASGNQWYLDGNPIGGATAQSYVASIAGNYTVVTTSLGCPSAASAPTAVTINPIPETPVITGTPAFCAGGSTTLSSSSAAGNQWFLDGNPIGGATGQTYAASVAGSYTVVVTTTGCTSATSAPVVVTATAAPATPVISGSLTFCPGGSTTLSSSSATGNQWFLNGSPIGGATAQTYAATTPGSYTVVVTASSCPSAPSAPAVVSLAAAPDATITAPATAFNGASGYTASTANAGAGATYNWTVTGGTLTAGQGTRTITFSTGAAGSLSINVTVTNGGGCSDTKSASITVATQRFNPNGDNAIDPADIFYLISYLFTGGPAPSGAAGLLSGDANNDGIVDPADIFYVINHLFSGGPRPSAVDPSDADIESQSVRSLAGAVSLGAPVRRGDRISMPVVVTINEGSEVPQAIALRVNLEGAVIDAAVNRAGVAAGLKSAFEATRALDGSVWWIVSFDRSTALDLRAGVPTVVGEVVVTASGRLSASIDGSVTMLADAGGKLNATAANGSLSIGRSVTTSDRETPRRTIEGVE